MELIALTAPKALIALFPLIPPMLLIPSDIPLVGVCAEPTAISGNFTFCIRRFPALTVIQGGH